MFEIHEAKADDDALSDIPDLIDFNGLSEHRTSAKYDFISETFKFNNERNNFDNK